MPRAERALAPRPGRDPGRPDNGPLPTLIEEAKRQLEVCNACRYCEGFCAVFPALERRASVDSTDVTQLANLCHDCRACNDACMYTPPHEFDIELPKVLSAVRLADYRRYVWPSRPHRAFSGWIGVIIGAVSSTLIVFALAIAHTGWGGLTAYTGHASSPYSVIPYPVLLALMASAGLFAAFVILNAGRLYWHAVGRPRQRGWKPIWRATANSVTLRFLRGGGGGCYYPEEDEPSSARRRLHHVVAYGYGLCAVSTVAAGVSQDLLATRPPYPWLSVPVITGTLGGIGLVLGSAILLALKARSAPANTFQQMTVKDYGFLTALTFLGLSGLAVLLTRNTPAFGIVLVVHLAAVLETFAMAPYSKFVHVVFRFLALLCDDLERMPR